MVPVLLGHITVTEERRIEGVLCSIRERENFTVNNTCMKIQCSSELQKQVEEECIRRRVCDIPEVDCSEGGLTLPWYPPAIFDWRQN